MKNARIFTCALVACSAMALTATGAQAQRHPLNVPAAGSPIHPAAATQGQGLGAGIWAARVDSNAQLINGAGATGAMLIADGIYEVDFDRDVSNCFYTASSFTSTVATQVEPRAGNVKGVFLVLESQGTTTADPEDTSSPFYLQVYCAS